MKSAARGFTLVEIAVVLVIIGLLLGAILQGQQLIASARVSNLSDQQSGIQAAYFGFIDRYRAVPGDMDQTDAENAIGTTINLGGNGDGRLGPPEAAGGGTVDWGELNGVWEHLAKAGFIRGSYGDPANDGGPPTSDDAPVNAFNGVLMLARHDGYEDSNASPPERLLLHLGRNVPASIARELDVKLDDGRPQSGALRNSADGSNEWESDAACVDTAEDPVIWDVETDAQDCNPAFIF